MSGTRKALVGVLVYGSTFLVIYGLFLLIRQYEALNGLYYFLVWLGFGFFAVWVWKTLRWFFLTMGETYFQWGLPWQCVLRGHGIVRYKEGPLVVTVTDQFGRSKTYRKSWTRRSCARCTDIPVRIPDDL